MKSKNHEENETLKMKHNQEKKIVIIFDVFGN